MASILIMGSQNAPHILGREPTDIDLLVRPDHLKAVIADVTKGKHYTVSTNPTGSHVFLLPKNAEDKIYDIELAWEGSSGELLLQMIDDGHLDCVFFDSPIDDGVDVFGCEPELVYTFKMSHRFKKNTPHFHKTMDDIRALRAAGHGTIPSQLQEWFKLREKETYAYKHPKLQGVKKEEFFNGDGVTYVFDHDAIHEVVRLGPKPAYKYFQPEGEQVGTSREMFEACPKIIQLRAVYEESCVLSLERSIVPHSTWNDLAKRKWAFEYALEKVCTSITSGWFREFAWEHHDEVLAMFDPQYVDRFYTAAYELGLVAPHQEKEHE